MKKSRLLGAICGVLVIQAIMTTHAVAGFIMVSGDLSLGNGLNSSGPHFNPDNQTWFTNILGAGTTVKLQNDYTGGGSIVPAGLSINDHYNSLSGVTSSLVVSGAVINDTLLAGVDLYIGMVPNDNYNTSEVDALSDFLSSGGSLFLLGDHTGWSDENSRINALLGTLGSGMSIVNAQLDPGDFTTTNIDVDALNTGVNSLYFGSVSTVLGGTSLIRTTNNTTFIAYETVSSVPVPSAVWLFGSGILGLIGVARRKVMCSQA